MTRVDGAFEEDELEELDELEPTLDGVA